MHRALADGPGVPRTASCPHRAQCRFALPDTAVPVFTSRPACSGRRCWSAGQSACPGCPVYVLLPSPPARTAQCHPSLPLCLITTVLREQGHCTVRVLGPLVLMSLCSPRARAARCVCQCSVRLPGLPNATPPTCRLCCHTHVALVRSLGPSLSIPRFASRPYARLTRPRPPARPALLAANRSWVRHGAGPSTWPALQADGPRRPMRRITQR